MRASSPAARAISPASRRHSRSCRTVSSASRCWSRTSRASSASCLNRSASSLADSAAMRCASVVTYSAYQTAPPPSVLNGTSVVQDDAEERAVDLEPAVVLDQPELPELVHEEVHARAGRPDHFRQRLLRDLRQRVLWIDLAVPRQQQERPGES